MQPTRRRGRGRGRRAGRRRRNNLSQVVVPRGDVPRAKQNQALAVANPALASPLTRKGNFEQWQTDHPRPGDRFGPFAE
jgi:hypothetical protein